MLVKLEKPRPVILGLYSLNALSACVYIMTTRRDEFECRLGGLVCIKSACEEFGAQEFDGDDVDDDDDDEGDRDVENVKKDGTEGRYEIGYT